MNKHQDEPPFNLQNHLIPPPALKEEFLQRRQQAVPEKDQCNSHISIALLRSGQIPRGKSSTGIDTSFKSQIKKASIFF